MSNASIPAHETDLWIEIHPTDTSASPLLKCPKCNCVGNVTFLPSKSAPENKKCTCADCGYRWLFVKSDANANEDHSVFSCGSVGV